MNTAEIDKRIAALRLLTPVEYEQVSIPNTQVKLTVVRPADIDALLEGAMDDPEQNLPYWAEIWPSGIALATEILNDPEIVAGKNVIELGCGVGITAAAAMRAGANLLATDYSPHSLLLTELTCLLHDVRLPAVRQLNWRDEHADLMQADGSGWPVVLAADVLYEERDIDPVLRVLQRILAPDGTVWLAEPGRRPSKLAIERAMAQGWSIESRTHHGPWPDRMDTGVVVTVHRMRHLSH